jgi:hypothetical protein
LAKRASLIKLTTDFLILIIKKSGFLYSIINLKRSGARGRTIKMDLKQISYKNVRTKVGRKVTVKTNAF